MLAGRADRRRQLVRRPRLIEEVGRTADLEGGVGRQNLAGAHAVRSQRPAEGLRGGHGSSIIWIRRTCRPPSNGVSSQICTMERARSSGIIRWPRESMLASLCWRPRRADSSFQQRTQRMPAHPVGGDRLAVAGAAEHDPALDLPRRHRQRHRPDERRVVDRHLGLGAEVLDLVAELGQVLLDLFLVAVAGVVGADADLHLPLLGTHRGSGPGLYANRTSRRTASRGIHPGAMRRRRTSNSTSAAATVALSDSTAGSIGMASRSPARASRAEERPGPSAPTARIRVPSRDA